MVIAQLSDTHILADASDQAASRAENLRACVAGINREGVDAVIHTGDSVHNGTVEEYAYFREIVADLEAPLFLIPGNRDRRDALRTALDHLAYLPAKGDDLHYAIEDTPIRLVALDSAGDGDRKGVFCARRQAWLEETLAREPGRPTIMFAHHPPFDIASHYVGGYRHPRDADDLTAVVARHPQVKRLLCGHVHCLHQAPWAGTQAVVMPSVAVDLRLKGDSSVPAAPVYMLHVAGDDGEVASHARILTH